MAAEELSRAHGSDLSVSESQRARLLSATFALVWEGGYACVSARSVSARAGVSVRAFQQAFGDREDCFLAAFNHAVQGLELEARAGWESELGWTARVRAALAALLLALDRDPAVRRLVFVEALAAGPRVLAARARVLEGLAGVVDGGRANAQTPGQLPALVAEGVVGGAFGVIHARLLERRPEPLVGLLGQLMAMIVFPYRRGAAAARELERPAPRPAFTRRPEGGDLVRRPAGGAAPVDYRLTARARAALVAVTEQPGLNNREVSEIVGLADQGQISRIMKRLVDQGLVENAQTHTRRLTRAWRLTAYGEAVTDTRRGAGASPSAKRSTRNGAGAAADSGRRGQHRRIAPAGGQAAAVQAGFRLTALTHEILTAVANLAERGAGPGPSNREIARVAEVKDEGQISKLLARLQRQGLLENTGGHPSGGNAWRLTSRGDELLEASRPGEGRPS